MRASPLILALLLASAAAAQTPPQRAQGQVLSEQQVAEMRRKGLLPAEDHDPSDDPPPSEECTRALKDIDKESAASDRALQRGEAEPSDLKQVYEQDMYYADKRLKAINRLCLADGKSRSHDFGRWRALQAFGTNQQGCEIVAKNCKPMKHW